MSSNESKRNRPEDAGEDATTDETNKKLRTPAADSSAAAELPELGAEAQETVEVEADAEGEEGEEEEGDNEEGERGDESGGDDDEDDDSFDSDFNASEGEDDGEEQSAEDTARAMKEGGEPIEIIAEYTGLTPEQIAAL